MEHDRNDEPVDMPLPLTSEERRDVLGRLSRRRSALTAHEVTLLRAVYEDLVAEHRKQVFALLHKKGLSVAAAEDAYQEIFTGLFTFLCANGFPESPAALLYTIADRKSCDQIRPEAGAPVTVGLPSSGSEPPRTPQSIEGALDRKRVAREIFARLSADQQRVLHLVDVRGLTYEQAAEALKLPVATFKSRLFTARARFAELAAELLPPSQRRVA